MRVHVHHLLAEAAQRFGQRPALTFRDDTWTYAELWSIVLRTGQGLSELGVQPGDRVAVFLDKRLETAAALFGIAAAGGVFVPINPVLKAPQVAHILRDCDVRVLITTPERLRPLREQLAGCKALEQLVLVGGEPGEQPGDGPAVHGWQDLLAAAGAAPASAEPALTLLPPVGATDSDVAAILYTSGSTGQPKGVVLSHRNVLVGAESVSGYLGNTEHDVILAALPLSFDAGLSQLTTAFAVGAHVVLMNYLMPTDVPRLCAKHGVTGLTCVAPLWIQIADQSWPQEARERLRYFANTGGRMPRTTLDKLRALFPTAAPFLMYGLTEAFRSTYLDPAQVDARPDSIGKAIPNARVLVLRPDGSECAPGEHGELVHAGPLVSLGYWNDPERTATRFRPAPVLDGVQLPGNAVWSGDTVVRDEEGYLYFVGRDDDMIKSSGYRISPTEIEEAAYATGLIRDAVALGRPDPALGHRIVLVAAAHEASTDEAAILAALRSSVPPYMVPAQVVLRTELPPAPPNGKFDRALIAQQEGTR